MKKIDLKKIIEAKYPTFFNKYPKILSHIMLAILNKLLCIKQINNFLEKHNDKDGIDFIRELFDYLEFSYLMSDRDLEKIPAEGKLICVSNHPLGSLDGLALIKMIYRVRTDVKIVVNDVLTNIPNIREFLIPFDVFTYNTKRDSIHKIKEALMQEEAVIFFPAAEVSRFGFKGIRDRKWKPGAIKLAKKLNVPILPIFIKGRNSVSFYITSLIYKNLSTFLLPRELFNKKKDKLRIKIGDLIPAEYLGKHFISNHAIANLLKRHVYHLNRDRKLIFKTQQNIIHPVKKKNLKNELAASEKICDIDEDKQLYLVKCDEAPNLLREISRLREITFRKVGEGTGKKADYDKYDKYYRHIILWNSKNFEIMGSYRFGIGKEILDNNQEFYTSTLFDFSEQFNNLLPHSLELGRSFIQYKYWRTRSLDYLWKGIGQYLKKNPQIKYLFGAVSISNNYSSEAKAVMISFYRKWYSTRKKIVLGKNPYHLTLKDKKLAREVLTGKDLKSDYKKMTKFLQQRGCVIPILFKQYSKLSTDGGISYLEFNIDPDFSNAIDGLVLIERDKLSERALKRYLS